MRRAWTPRCSSLSLVVLIPQRAMVGAISLCSCLKLPNDVRKLPTAQIIQRHRQRNLLLLLLTCCLPCATPAGCSWSATANPGLNAFCTDGDTTTVPRYLGLPECQRRCDEEIDDCVAVNYQSDLQLCYVCYKVTLVFCLVSYACTAVGS